MESREQLERRISKSTRSVIVLAIYRWIVGLLFLFTAFRHFPEHRLVIASGYLFFATGISALVKMALLTSETENYRTDAAERKTRLAIITAQQWSARGDTIDPILFWSEVDESVENERGPPFEPNWWASTGAAISSLIGTALADVVGIGIVYAISG